MGAQQEIKDKTYDLEAYTEGVSKHLNILLRYTAQEIFIVQSEHASLAPVYVFLDGSAQETQGNSLLERGLPPKKILTMNEDSTLPEEALSPEHQIFWRAAELDLRKVTAFVLARRFRRLELEDIVKGKSIAEMEKLSYRQPVEARDHVTSAIKLIRSLERTPDFNLLAQFLCEEDVILANNNINPHLEAGLTTQQYNIDAQTALMNALLSNSIRQQVTNTQDSVKEQTLSKSLMRKAGWADAHACFSNNSELITWFNKPSQSITLERNRLLNTALALKNIKEGARTLIHDRLPGLIPVQSDITIRLDFPLNILETATNDPIENAYERAAIMLAVQLCNVNHPRVLFNRQ